jgi:predicted AAA+ superfamily ATPase
MILRHLTERLLAALADSPVVFLRGARQTGKSTLVQRLAGREHPARYLTLDDATILAAAREDPAGFLSDLEGPVILDEVQRAPALLPAIKIAVDRDRRPGRFLLTGSADVLLLPRLAESLAGRMEILTLWPFSQGEIHGRRERFVDRMFARSPGFKADPATGISDLTDRLLKGGYPEAMTRSSRARRDAWFGSYVTTILQRDVRDLASIEHLTALPRLLALLAARSATLLNVSEISRSLAIPYATLNRYLSLLETTFFFQPVPAWSANLGKRLVKSPKVSLIDTGLAAHLLGISRQRLKSDRTLGGHLWESFVVAEIRKQIGWSRVVPSLFHFRERTGLEVDIVLEDSRGLVVGIEVKASMTVLSSDFKGLRFLKETLGDRFRRGVVLYVGNEVVPFGGKLAALPMSTLWQAD